MRPTPEGSLMESTISEVDEFLGMSDGPPRWTIGSAGLMASIGPGSGIPSLGAIGQ